MSEQKGVLARAQAGFMGSLREALAAASREDTVEAAQAAPMKSLPQLAAPTPMSGPADAGAHTQMTRREQSLPPAAEAVREARAGAPNVPPLARAEVMLADSDDGSPTTRVVRRGTPPRAAAGSDGNRTQVLRGKPKVARGEFEQDPVVGWLVVVGGPGLGSFRPVFEGNNTVGRSAAQRVPLDFGDDAISSEEQAYIRYDSAERAFLFVPNLAKTNIVSVNGKRPTAAVPLVAMDVIQMGRTQLVFVPFCGADFDWSEINDKTT